MERRFLKDHRPLCILILGPHRSGTSALAGAIYRLGLHFGSGIMIPSYDNPRGFYENEKIVSLNEVMLSALGQTWDDLGNLHNQTLSSEFSAQFKARIIALVKREMASHPCLVIKDPRLCILLPIWKTALREAGIYTKVILNYRDLAETSLSLRARNDLSLTKGALLTIGYLLSAEKHSRDVPRTRVRYKDVLADPVVALSGLFERLGLEFEMTEEARTSIAHFINDKLRHQQPDHKDSPFQLEKTPYSTYLAESNTWFSREFDHPGPALHEGEAWDQRWLTHRQVVNEYMAKDHPPERLFAKLLVNDGQGYSEKNAHKTQVDTGRQKLQFRLAAGLVVHELTLIPVHKPCSLRILKIDVLFKRSAVPYTLSDNSLSRDGNLLHFDVDVPKIILTFNPPKQVDDVVFNIDYIRTGAAVKISQPSKNHLLTALFGTVKSAARHPLRVLREINVYNLNKLRWALQREPPQLILRNMRKFFEREKTQHEILTKRPLTETQNSGMDLLQQADAHRLVVVYVFDELPSGHMSSGHRRSARILEILSEFANVHVHVREVYTDEDALHYEHLGIKIWHTSDTKSMLKNLRTIDFIIFSHYYMVYEADLIMRSLTEARVIVDSVDIHWVREERALLYDGEYTADLVARNKAREIKAYQQANAVWVVSQPDRKALQAEIPGANIAVVSNIHEPETTLYKHSEERSFLFFANYRHRPNISCAKFLAEVILPGVRRDIPDARLILAGAHADDEISELKVLEGVDFRGFIPEKDLPALYAESRLAAAPLLYGSGIKGKILEAICFMTPVVTNDIGNEGINLVHGISGLIANEEELFIDYVSRALRGDYNLKQLAQNAQQVIKSLVGTDHVRQEIISSLYCPVTICIVTWNRLDLLKSCIDSILENTDYKNYCIRIHSNGCTDGTLAYLQQLQHQNTVIRYTRSEQNEGFVKPNNAMMRAAGESDVVLLNNDTRVTSGWLTALYKTAYSRKKTGIVGAKILYPQGDLQEFGSEIYDDGRGRNHGKGDAHPFSQPYSTTKPAGYVSGCAMYIKRTTIRQIGTFDEVYDPCYYEDSDLCYRAWENDIATMVCPDSVVYHLEGATAGTETDSHFKRFQEVNKTTFLAKHQRYLPIVKRKIRKLEKQLKKRPW